MITYAIESKLIKKTCSCKVHSLGRCLGLRSQKTLIERYDGSFGFGMKSDQQAINKFTSQRKA